MQLRQTISLLFTVHRVPSQHLASLLAKDPRAARRIKREAMQEQFLAANRRAASAAAIPRGYLATRQATASARNPHRKGLHPPDPPFLLVPSACCFDSPIAYLSPSPGPPCPAASEFTGVSARRNRSLARIRNYIGFAS